MAPLIYTGLLSEAFKRNTLKFSFNVTAREYTRNVLHCINVSVLPIPPSAYWDHKEAFFGFCLKPSSLYFLF
jgi:hypothetical protein